MIRHLLLLIVTGTLFLQPLPGLAAPQLAVQVLEKGTSLSFQITPSDGASGCEYNIYGTSKRKQVSGASPKAKTILAEGQLMTDNGTTFLVSDLSLIRRRGKNKKQQLFFRVRELCGTTRSFSKIVKRRLRTNTKKKQSTKIKGWLSALRDALPFSHLTYEDAFPNITFTQPTDLRHADDGTNRLFIVQLRGQILVVNNDSSATSADTFLDISDKVQTGGEQGLLSLAFHPDFETNRFIYVHYSAADNDGATTIARYTVDENDPNSVDETTELILFTAAQPRNVHNGGSLLFGPDGYLYITIGDGGFQGDPDGNGQNRATALGKILRIDVDNTAGMNNYAIPTDNPHTGNSDGFLEEIFAYGVRNPWRASFDRETGDLWVADVGHDTYEEINIVTSGDNLGWNTMEGFSCYNDTPCSTEGLQLPMFDYGREYGSSVTGGYVYRGAMVPALTGRYLFGDFIAGNVFTFRSEGSSFSFNVLFETEMFISSFGEDESGEVFIVDYGAGKVYKIVQRT